MIPRADITEWRFLDHPWQSDAMVEQDLIISVMLAMLFNDDSLGGSLLFRGGTALHKLLLDHPQRYSEDIDLVQRRAGPIGPQFDRIREVLRSRFGEPQRKIGRDIATLTYRATDSCSTDPTTSSREGSLLSTKPKSTIGPTTSVGKATRAGVRSADRWPSPPTAR